MLQLTISACLAGRHKHYGGFSMVCNLAWRCRSCFVANQLFTWVWVGAIRWRQILIGGCIELGVMFAGRLRVDIDAPGKHCIGGSCALI